MKILAHSLVPVNPTPYMHLGYVSAYAEETLADRPLAIHVLLAGGVVIVFAGIMLLARQLTRAPRRLWTALSLIGIGAALVVASLVVRAQRMKVPQPYLHPRVATRDHIDMITYGLRMQLFTGESVQPGVITRKYSDTGYYQQKSVDGWRRPLRIEKRLNHDGYDYAVVSAGPDGQFATRDDIIGTVITAKDVTIERSRALGDIIQGRLQSGQIISAHIRELPYRSKHRNYGSEILLDGWSHPFIMAKEFRNNRNTYTITSAGPDGKPGTADDLVTTVDAKTITQPK